MKKWAHELNGAHKYIKRYSTSLVIKEKQIKTTVTFHPTSVIKAIFKNKTTTNVGEDVSNRNSCNC
jgi:hypothetical protein